LQGRKRSSWAKGMVTKAQEKKIRKVVSTARNLDTTMTLDAEPETNSEDENEVYSKIPIAKLIESLKELLTHFENRSNELKDLKEKYASLMKQHEKTLLDLEESEK